MSHYIIIGHPESGYKLVENRIKDYGMQSALPSKNKYCSAKKINKALCKANGGPLINELKAGEEITQIKPDSVWDGMAMDLMLRNIDQSSWGWSDPQAIFLLKYWRTIDPKATFILIYDSPQSALAPVFNDDDSMITKGALSKRIRNWASYNDSLLRFFHRNRENCLLVHSKQVQTFPESFIELFRKQTRTSVINSSKYRSNCDTNKAALDISAEEQLSLHVFNNYINQYPKIRQLFEELQSVADLPLLEQELVSLPPSDILLSSVIDRKRQLKIEQSVFKYQHNVETLEHKNQKLLSLQQDYVRKTELLSNQLSNEQSEHRNIFQELQLQLQEQQEQTGQLNSELKQSKNKAAQILQQYTDLTTESRSEIKQIQEENKLLLSQLHTVQKELENYYLKHPAEFGYYYGAGERVKQHLSYRLGATMISNSRHLFGWFYMPLALFRELRQFRKDKVQRKALQLPPIKKYQDAKDAERVQQHLSYRLGRVLIANIHSPIGWLKLPFALRKEVKSFRHNKQTT